MARFQRRPNKPTQSDAAEAGRDPVADAGGEALPGKTRVHRNPSGRSARIAPELRTSSLETSESDSELGVEKVTPVASEVLSAPITVLTELRDLEADFSPAQVTGSYRRERSIEGLLYGAAIGDALGLGRANLSRRSSLRIMGRGPIDYCLIPGLGIVSADTHSILMTLQSILRSRSQTELFRRNLAMRLRFYLFTLPVTAGRSLWLAAVRLCLGVQPDQSGIQSNDNAPLVNAVAIATVLQGTGHSVERWIAISNETTQISPQVNAAGVLMARATYLAIMTDPESFVPSDLIHRLIETTDDPQLKPWLEDLRLGLEERLGVHAMARRLGWPHRIPNAAGPMAIMAIYSWLRHHGNYEKVVTQAILLGGDSSTLGALSGALAGIHLGVKEIPERWRRQVFTWPNHRRWMESLVQRFTDWPHGSEDLHDAPAMPARPVLQLVRSVILAGGVAMGAMVKIPWRFSHWVTRA